MSNDQKHLASDSESEGRGFEFCEMLTNPPCTLGPCISREVGSIAIRSKRIFGTPSPSQAWNLHWDSLWIGYCMSTTIQKYKRLQPSLPSLTGRWRPPRVYLFKVLPGVEQGWHYVFGAAPSPVHLYEFIGVWVSAEHLNGLCVRPWVLGVLHTPNGRVVPIHLGASFHA